MTSKQLVSWAGLAVAIGGALATAGGFLPQGPIEVIVVSVGAAFAAFGESITNKETTTK